MFFEFKQLCILNLTELWYVSVFITMTFYVDYNCDIVFSVQRTSSRSVLPREI